LLPVTFPDTAGDYIYDVAVSAEFPPGDREAVDDALGQWRAAIPQLRLIVVPDCALPSNHHLICIAPATEEWLTVETGDTGVIGLTAHGPYEDVHVDIDLSREWMTAVVEHELGHAMGLHHNHHRHTLMYPSIDEGSLTITPADVHAWYFVPR
jgi:hypothetical protein